ncbi:hypothetical protein F4678DRAFT_465665 [Xylaria arbuscula]|nr:hypothetical protein F4678DRAFT_465665 [Xylaria arbuscula]
MADQDMRLRLVVRRHGLPELRLMWHVQLDTNPTISRLLEQLNDQVPLESDDWGLEDYVVELHDSDGTDFECLHYQLVRSVLQPDDRVFIRALDRDDHRRRRISGRHQVSSDGRHLIDGVPFGRPHLRSTTGRPSIHIPPLKRARHTYTQPDGGDSDASFEIEGNSPVGLLTNGESYGDGSTIMGGFGDADSNADDTDFEDHAESSNPGSSTGEPHDEDEEGEEQEVGDPSDEDEGDLSECEEDEDLDQEARDLANEIEALEGHDPSGAPVMRLDTLDKLSALRAALPTAPIDRCERMLAVCGGDLKTTYNTLRRKYLPIMSLKAVLSWEPGNKNASENLRKSQPPVNLSSAGKNAIPPLTGKRKFQEQSPVHDSDDDDHESSDDSLMRKYDHAGFPPGTITSGKGLAQMAEISASFDNNRINGNSEATSTTLKASTHEPIDEEDDDTSSSGSSSDSSTSSDESDNASEDGSSGGHSSSQSSSADSDDSDSDGDDDSSKGSKRLGANDVHSSSESDTSDSDSDSDSGPEEHSSKMTGRGSHTAEDKGSIDSSESSDKSSNSDSSSESEEDADDASPNNEVLTTKDIKASQTVEQPHPLSSKPKEANSTTAPVPPGAGKESTRRRNARRRAAKLAKRKVQEPPVDVTSANVTDHIPVKDGNPGVVDDATALFEARRKALLEAIAAGGIEVGPSGETTLDDSFAEADHTKRKHIEGGTNSQHDENGALIETPMKSPADNQAESANQKKRRIDIGAGRRLVFGALGVRNPKNKEDEDKLRDQLQAAAKPRVNPQSSSQTQPIPDEVERVDEEQQDLDAWKLKINYRAVECCRDNAELSPAPFPFQQRWDPQQQRPSLSKKNKRGGQGKRAQRDQSQYYDDSYFDKKRKYRHSYDFEDNAYDEEGDPTDEFDVTLNYDDVENQDGDQDHETAHETSQTTDLDDLPSLPKDVSELPILRPGEAKAGMVIAWLKWTCSSATGWQPQVSRVTAIVARVDHDATMLNVCLAKRDRHLDESEKRYDYVTGKRIYDRFEAPDLSEEEEINDDGGDAGADEGYRDVPWADIQDPRILQYPLNPTAESGSSAECINSAEVDNETTRRSEKQVDPTAPLASGHQEPDPISSLARLNHHEPVQITGEASFSVDENTKQSALAEERPNDYGVESSVKAASNATSHQDGQIQQATDLAMSDTSQVSSPSRQLLDMSSKSPVYDWAPTSSIELGESPRADIPSSMPVSASTSFRSRPEEDPHVSLEVPAQEVIPSSVSSIHGGRQLDYAMIDDNYLPDPFDATDDTDHQDYEHEPNITPPARSSLTPIPNRRTVTPDPNDELMETEKAMGSSPLASSTSSLPSLSTLWCSARTSHSTQNSSKAQESSVLSKPPAPKFPRDAKYEEAMRKLDEEFDDAASPMPADKSFQVKREPSSQFQATRVVKAISPPPRRRRFTIPPGSQVVELSSDSESAYSEKYADDAIDQNYTPGSDSLPKGDGWVKKRQKARKSVI